jgi:translation initiation factor IF-2
MLKPESTEEILGTGEIIAEFPFEKLRVAGVRVTDGRIARGDLVRIGELKSKVKSLRVGKEETNKVEKGRECGVLLDPQVDFVVGNDIMSYRIV